ncbi:MAG: OmpA family protein [Candidatus Nitrohelix vancouverensis]|uniref:OmpA family protein n=1 Tax=Candidatus Nitrohelix vancouverensis TaxID=2705534 RepID=A0A7T0C3M0_9BACT|nr:MAG: OmpA family protein [Candidatus Nitrohelix vancouverensis]
MATINDPKLINKIVLQYHQGDSIEKICDQYSIQQDQFEFWLHQHKAHAWRIFSPDFLKSLGGRSPEEEEATPQIIQQIIIKKKKGGHGGGHHGGSWKVAYADFVTAMMAFFLLMWLINMVPAETKGGLSEYFTDPEKFLASGGSLATATSNPMPDPNGVSAQDALMGNASPDAMNDIQKMAQRAKISMLAENIRRDVNEKFNHLKGQILMEPVGDGLRIQILDRDNLALFDPGSTELNKRGRQMVRMLSENIKGLSNKLIVEGHTDASAFRGSRSKNWDLSVLRAVAARQEFEKNGVDKSYFEKVVGYADTQPYNPQNLLDPMNRRISIIVRK